MLCVKCKTESTKEPCVKCKMKMQKLIFVLKQSLKMVVVYGANENVKSLGN